MNGVFDAVGQSGEVVGNGRPGRNRRLAVVGGRIAVVRVVFRLPLQPVALGVGHRGPLDGELAVASGRRDAGDLCELLVVDDGPRRGRIRFQGRVHFRDRGMLAQGDGEGLVRLEVGVFDRSDVQRDGRVSAFDGNVLAGFRSEIRARGGVVAAFD